LAGRITQVLRPDAFWPAVSQGALGIQIRCDDDRIGRALEPLDDTATHLAVRAERSCLAALAGGCLAPIGAWGHHAADGRLELGGCVLEEAENGVVRIAATVRAEGTAGDFATLSEWPESLGKELAGRLLSQGADAMLSRMRLRGH
jgi:hydroxymethylbilane synthase